MRQVAVGRYRDALSNRDFRLLLGAFAVDQVGTWAYNVVLLVYVYQRTGSTAAVAAVSAARWLPSLVLAPYAGLLADRYERTLVLRVSAVLAGSSMAVMAVVAAVDGPILALLALSTLTALLASPYHPAAGALRPEVVGERDLAAANALFSTLDSLVVVVGPLGGGLLLVLDQPGLAFGLNALTFFVAALLSARLEVRSVGSARKGEEPFLRQLGAGFVVVAREPVARTLVLFVALDSAVYGATTVLYLPMSEALGTGNAGSATCSPGSPSAGCWSPASSTGCRPRRGSHRWCCSACCCARCRSPQPS